MGVGVVALGYATIALAACGALVLSGGVARAHNRNPKPPATKNSAPPVSEYVRQLLERRRKRLEAGEARQARERNFDECILRHLAKVRTDEAVQRLVRACHKVAK